MGEFTEIKTQEELDKIIGERLKRERENVEKNFSDYEELKNSKTEYEKKFGEMSKSLEDANEKIKTYSETVKELNEKNAKYATDAAKTRIANEFKIPSEIASRLKGNSEDEIRKDAESLAGIFKKSEPLAHPESDPKETDSKKLAMKRMLKSMKGE